ncbi:hypothetical protein [Salana multivorans]
MSGRRPGLRAPWARRGDEMPGPPRSVEMNVGPSVPVAVVAGGALLSGTVTALACWWGGAGLVTVLALVLTLVAALVLSRFLVLAGWFALVGFTLLTTDGVLGGQRPLWVVATIASVHATLATARLAANLDLRGQIARSALLVRARTLLRPQLVAQAIGVLAWWPLSMQQPWFTAVALVGCACLIWLVLRHQWES